MCGLLVLGWDTRGKVGLGNTECEFCFESARESSLRREKDWKEKMELATSLMAKNLVITRSIMIENRGGVCFRGLL